MGSFFCWATTPLWATSTTTPPPSYETLRNFKDKLMFFLSVKRWILWNLSTINTLVSKFYRNKSICPAHTISQTPTAQYTNCSGMKIRCLCDSAIKPSRFWPPHGSSLFNLPVRSLTTSSPSTTTPQTSNKSFCKRTIPYTSSAPTKMQKEAAKVKCI